MTTNWSGLWALRRPPERIIEAARRAFDERSAPGTRPVDLVFDSFADGEWVPADTTRILMFSGEDLAVLLTSTRCAGGSRLGGAVFARTGSAGTAPVAVSLRQPKRATVAIPSTTDGRLLHTTVATGPSSVFARDTDAGQTWQSDWLTL